MPEDYRRGLFFDLSEEKLLTKVLVNGGCNYNGPKVAKFLGA